MTVSPKMTWSMPAVLKNLDLRGSTMGSRKEFADMVKFAREKKVKPVISKVVSGMDDLQKLETLWQDMKAGRQFGKLCVEISKETGASKL